MDSTFGMELAKITEVEIARIKKFKEGYLRQEEQQAQVDRRRLEFVRWLVKTGKLSDNVK